MLGEADGPVLGASPRLPPLFDSDVGLKSTLHPV